MNNIINELLLYSRIHLDLEKDELIYASNQIIDYLNLNSFKFVNVDSNKIKNMTTPEILLTELFNKAIEKGLVNEFEEDMFKTKIMGFLSLTNSELNRKFNELYKINEEKALDYIYQYGIKNYYIKKDAIDKNIVWNTTEFEDNIRITINLSKPEKCNKDIAKALIKNKEDNEKYPLCMLCKNNLGYVGKINYPARQTLRFINIEINNQPWFMQYSPYAYYYKHCIIINEEHTNMCIDNDTPKKLFDFLDKFPSFFVGSNADLPIVGGSILNHEHYQGGYERLPLIDSKIKKEYYHKKYKNIKIYELTWYAKTLRLVSKNKEDITKLFGQILDVWNNYTNESINVICRTDKQHNTVTPIAYLNENNEYVLDIIFRNNRTTNEYPEGIFHVDPKDHNIKKEGIGLIEAMGLFILPGRLKKEIELMINILLKKDNIENYVELEKHRDFIKRLEENNTDLLDYESCELAIRKEINLVCKNILNTVSVFKDNEIGNKAFKEFLQEGGIKNE